MSELFEKNSKLNEKQHKHEKNRLEDLCSSHFSHSRKHSSKFLHKIKFSSSFYEISLA